MKLFWMSMVILGITGVALGAVGVSDPTFPVVNSNVKIPMNSSDVATVPIAIHNNFGIPNWAGYIVRVHITDGLEVNLNPSNLVGLGGHLPKPTLYLPASTQASMATAGTAWHPAATQSGVNLPSSSIVRVLNLSLHASDKGGDWSLNSSPDVTVQAWNIKHLMPALPSDWLTLKISDFVWAPSNWDPIPGQVELPYPNEPGATGYHWWHMPFTTQIHFTRTTQGSNFIATLAGTCLIDVPEPTSGLMALGGIFSILMAFKARRRRLAA
jgi:hypothetical protein